MLVSFSVSNFRSFASEETFSLVASNRLSGSHENHVVPIPDAEEKLLRAAVLYGANAAGKSNLFQALSYVQSMAWWPRERNSGTGRTPFRFGGTPETPSTFDLMFIASNRLYRFGFKADDERITEEWLFRVIGGRQKVLYERATGEDGKVSVNAEGLKNAGDKLIALSKVGGPQNQPFLATVRATLEPIEEAGEDLRQVITWFDEGLRLIGPEARFGPLAYRLDRDPDFLSFAGGFLRAVSTGVDHLDIYKREVSEEDLRRLLSNSKLARLRGLAKRGNGAAGVELAEGVELLLEDKGGRFYQIDIKAAHEHERGKVVHLELAEESDGTRRLLNLIPALYQASKTGTVFFIDEIDRSLHPILVKEFLAYFLKSCANSQSQVIVTTHESNLLDQELLRRDEIWFAEKDQTGATRLYSLLDFKVRNDLEIRKHYLQGRFGAVPFLGSLDDLRPRAGSPE